MISKSPQNITAKRDNRHLDRYINRKKGTDRIIERNQYNTTAVLNIRRRHYSETVEVKKVPKTGQRLFIFKISQA